MTTNREKMAGRMATVDVDPAPTDRAWTPSGLAGRVYTVLGKTSLDDAAEWSPTNSATRFFKVKVDHQ